MFDYANADYDGLCEYLLEFDFSLCLQSNNTEQVWSIIKSTILCAMDLFIPKVHIKAVSYPKWYNSEIRHLIKCSHSLRRKYRRIPTPHNLSKLQSLQLRLKSLIISAKLRYENPGKIFKHITHLTSTSTVPSTVFLDSIISSSNQEKVLLFNKFFHSVFTQSTYQIPPLQELPTPSSIMSDIGISEPDVYEALRSLDISKATGIDGIGPKILFHCALALYKPLSPPFPT